MCYCELVSTLETRTSVTHNMRIMVFNMTRNDGHCVSARGHIAHYDIARRLNAVCVSEVQGQVNDD